MLDAATFVSHWLPQTPRFWSVQIHRRRAISLPSLQTLPQHDSCRLRRRAVSSRTKNHLNVASSTLFYLILGRCPPLAFIIPCSSRSSTFSTTLLSNPCTSNSLSCHFFLYSCEGLCELYCALNFQASNSSGLPVRPTLVIWPSNAPEYPFLSAACNILNFPCRGSPLRSLAICTFSKGWVWQLSVLLMFLETSSSEFLDRKSVV